VRSICMPESYGTRAAAKYICAVFFPPAYAPHILAAPCPTDAANPLPFAKNGGRAAAPRKAVRFLWPRNSGRAAPHFRNLREEFRAILAQLDSGGRACLPFSRSSGQGARLYIAVGLAEWMRTRLYPAQECVDAAVDDSSRLRRRLEVPW